MFNQPINPQYVSEVMAELTSAEKCLIRHGLDDYYGRGPTYFSQDYPGEERARKYVEYRAMLKKLRQLGIVEFGVLMNEMENVACGRGYWLGRFGRAVRDAIREEEDNEAAKEDQSAGIQG